MKANLKSLPPRAAVTQEVCATVSGLVRKRFQLRNQADIQMEGLPGSRDWGHGSAC